MRRLVLVLLGVIVLAALLGQLLVPGIAERRAEHRLERHGGKAEVSMSALPAARLLFHDGDSLTVKGSGLELDPAERGGDLDRMDGFDEVSVRLERLRSGPLHVTSLSIERDEREASYRIRISGSTSAAEVGSFLGGILGGLAGGSLPGGSAQVPVNVRARIASHDGKAQVRSATGTIAGVRADPIVQFVVAAVAARI